MRERERERVEKEELRATKMEFPISYCFIPVLVATKNIPSKNSLNPVINRNIPISYMVLLAGMAMIMELAVAMRARQPKQTAWTHYHIYYSMS